MSREFKANCDLVRQKQERKRTPEVESFSPCLLLSVFRSPSDRKALTRFSLEEKTGSWPFPKK